MYLDQGNDLSLTTPAQHSDFDSVNPGENWFFYWKTSASLWKSKIEAMVGKPNIIVPINWSFHSETGDTYDFATIKPETNLKKLQDIIQEAGKEVTFLLSLSPAPYLSNGGVPHLLARNISKNEDGIANAFIDSENNVNKIYSFFDTRVFQSFSKFCEELGRYFSEQGIGADIYGINNGYLKNNRFYSYIEDNSSTFEQAFSRFLRAREDNKLPNNQSEEESLKKEFTSSMYELYLQTAEEGLSANWSGDKQVVFLGGSSQDFFTRVFENDRSRDYTKSIFLSMQRDIIPSSCLLNHHVKKDNLALQLNDLVSFDYIKNVLDSGIVSEEDTLYYKPISFFEICTDTVNSDWKDLRLIESLDQKYKSTYKLKTQKDISYNDEINSEKVYFIEGQSIDNKLFNTILKMFMNGSKIILNRDKLDIIFLKKLETFFLENSLEIEKINFQTLIHNATIGEGRLLVFDGKKLKDIKESELEKFWLKIVSTFEINHPELSIEEGIDYFWRYRGCSTNELNYEEIRKLSIYNSTSYKKKVKVQFPKNIALLKLIDEVNVNVNHHPSVLDLEILPNGSLSIEMGVFS